MIRTSEQINELADALAKAQAELENVDKSGTNPAYKADGKATRYAKLDAVLDEVRPKFAKHGIGILQMAINGEGANIGVATRFTHNSGQWIESALFVAPTKFDAQGAGSVITYLRRYALMAMAGIAPEDDDGNAAVGRPEARPHTNGATRAASPPALPARNGVNHAAMPPSPEETPEVTAARQRVRMLIDKYDHIVRTAPSKHVLEVSLDDARDELAEIEAAGEAGKSAAAKLRDKAMRRLQMFDEQAA